MYEQLEATPGGRLFAALPDATQRANSYWWHDLPQRMVHGLMRCEEWRRVMETGATEGSARARARELTERGSDAAYNAACREVDRAAAAHAAALDEYDAAKAMRRRMFLYEALGLPAPRPRYGLRELPRQIELTPPTGLDPVAPHLH